MGYGAFNRSGGSAPAPPGVQPSKPSVGPMALMLCGFLGLAGFGYMHSQHSTPAAAAPVASDKPVISASTSSLEKGPALLAKLRGLESRTGSDIRTKARIEARAEVQDSSGLKPEDVRAIALRQIKSVYQTKLTNEEYGLTFSNDYKWEQYAQIFDHDWLAGIYSAIDASAEQRASEFPASAVHHLSGRRNSADDEPTPRIHVTAHHSGASTKSAKSSLKSSEANSSINPGGLAD